MYVYEEMVDGRKLSEIINTEHENPKYMPGVKLPDNVVCTHCTKLSGIYICTLITEASR